MLKKLILILIALIVIVAIAVMVFIATFDANNYKEEITSLVKKQTGRDLNIDGELKLAVYPDLGLEMGNTTLANAEGYAGSEFATVESGKVSLKLMPLLGKKIEADAIHLNGLKLNLHRKADGSSNWDDLAGGSEEPKSAEEKVAEEEKEPSQIVEELMQNLSIAGVNLKNANIHWRDDMSKQDIQLSPLNVKTGKFTPGKPLPVELDLVMKQKSPAMTVAAEGDTTITLSKDNQNFSLSKLNLQTKVTGAQIPNGALDATVSGDIKGSPQKINIAGLNLQTTLTGDLIPEGAIKANATGDVDFDVSGQQLTIAGLKLDANVNGKPLAGGSLQALVSGDTIFNLGTQKLSIPNLALDGKLAEGFVKGGAASAKINGNAQFDLAKQLLVITGMKAVADASGEVLQGGNANTNIAGDINLDLGAQKLSIPNLALDAKLAGGYVKGGAANTKVSGNTQFDLAKQLLSITGLKVVADANGELLQGGKANTNFAGDLQVDLTNSQVKSPQISLNSQVEGGLIPGGKLTQTGNGNIDLNWANGNGAVNLANLLVNVAGLEVKGSKVQLQPLAAKPAVSGQFQTNTFNLKELLKTLGIEPPVTSNPTALSKVQAQFSLKADTENADLQGLKATLDKSTLTGNLGIKNFLSPSINTKLTVNTINLDDYLAPSSDAGEAKPTTATASSSAPQELLPLETLRNLNIDGSFKIGNMVVNKLKMSNINAGINAKQGLVVIDPANAQLYKGKYEGRITVDAKQATPTMKMRHELAGIRSEGLLFDLFEDKYISGGAKMVTELSSSGNTIDALLKNLNGTTSMAFNDGTIRDSNLAEKVSIAVKAFEKKEVEGDKSTVTFTGLSGDWKTNNGVFATDNLSLLSPYFNIKGEGTADVASQKLDMTLRIGPKKQNEKRPLYAPIRITGTFSDPKFSLDMKDMLKALAAQDLEELKLKAEKKLAEEKAALKLKLDNEKAALELKLKNEKAAAAKKLQDEKAAVALKLQKEKAAQQQKLQQKLDKAKADAAKKLQSATGDKGKQLLNKITGSKQEPAAEGEEAPAEAPKSAEDQVKDKLKNKLKGLF